MGHAVSNLRVGVLGLGVGQLHLLSWLGVDGRPWSPSPNLTSPAQGRRHQLKTPVPVGSLDEASLDLGPDGDWSILPRPQAGAQRAFPPFPTTPACTSSAEPLVAGGQECDRLASAAAAAVEATGAV